MKNIEFIFDSKYNGVDPSNKIGRCIEMIDIIDQIRPNRGAQQKAYAKSKLITQINTIMEPTDYSLITLSHKSTSSGDCVRQALLVNVTV